MTDTESGVPGLISFKPGGPRPGSAAGDTDLPLVRRRIIDTVMRFEERTPRSLQTTMGPSQAAHPCARHLVYSFSGKKQLRRFIDPWPSFMGSAAHDRLDAAFRKEGNGEWLLDRRVHTGFDSVPSGKLDAHYLTLNTLIDFKVLGDTVQAKIAKERNTSSYYQVGQEGGQYYGQLQVYGYGLRREGIAVDTVALAVFRRSGRLNDLILRAFPYREDVAEWILRRTDAARLIGMSGLDPLEVPVTVTGKGCSYCPFKSGSDEDSDEGYCDPKREGT